MRDAASVNDDDDNKHQAAVGDPSLLGGAAAGGSTDAATAGTATTETATTTTTTTTIDGQPALSSTTTAAAGGGDTSDLVAPFPADLPPYPSTFRTLDVQREVELVREARKRIRLGAEAYAPEPPLIPTTTTTTTTTSATPSGPGNKAGAGALGVSMLGGRNSATATNTADEREDRRKGIGKPSVCLFTLHDTGDRCVSIRAFFFRPRPSVFCSLPLGLCWRPEEGRGVGLPESEIRVAGKLKDDPSLTVG